MFSIFKKNHQKKEVDQKRSETISSYHRQIRIPSKKGYRQDLGVNTRSKMEANVYRAFLYIASKHDKIKVEYEPEIFFFKPNQYNVKAYIPDIKITLANGYSYYIEVKGVWDLKSYQKTILFQKDYRRLKLKFIGVKQYEKLKRQFSHLLPEWEY